MSPDLMRGFLQAGILVAIVSLVFVFTAAPNSAEFVISVCSLGIGLALVGLVSLIIWLGQR